MSRYLLIRRVMLGVLCLWCLGPSSGWAGEGHDRLTQFLSGLETLQARFEQQILNREDNTSGYASGSFELFRPGRFRWDYDGEEGQTIIADGRDVWIIDAELVQITQHRQSWALKGTAARLLAEEIDIAAEFELRELGDRRGHVWLQLLPRDEDSQFESLLLGFAGNDLSVLEMRDSFDQLTRFRFFDIQRNLSLDPDRFTFDPPDSWDVFGSY